MVLREGPKITSTRFINHLAPSIIHLTQSPKGLLEARFVQIFGSVRVINARLGIGFDYLSSLPILPPCYDPAPPLLSGPFFGARKVARQHLICQKTRASRRAMLSSSANKHPRMVGLRCIIGIAVAYRGNSYCIYLALYILTIALRNQWKILSGASHCIKWGLVLQLRYPVLYSTKML